MSPFPGDGVDDTGTEELFEPRIGVCYLGVGFPEGRVGVELDFCKNAWAVCTSGDSVFAAAAFFAAEAAVDESCKPTLCDVPIRQALLD